MASSGAAEKIGVYIVILVTFILIFGLLVSNVSAIFNASAYPGTGHPSSVSNTDWATNTTYWYNGQSPRSSSNGYNLSAYVSVFGTGTFTVKIDSTLGLLTYINGNDKQFYSLSSGGTVLDTLYCQNALFSTQQGIVESQLNGMVFVEKGFLNTHWDYFNVAELQNCYNPQTCDGIVYLSGINLYAFVSFNTTQYGATAQGLGNAFLAHACNVIVGQSTFSYNYGAITGTNVIIGLLTFNSGLYFANDSFVGYILSGAIYSMSAYIVLTIFQRFIP